jgi:hypothetical protein
MNTPFPFSQTFPATSRYFTVGQGQRTTPDGRTIAYVLRRFVPPPSPAPLFLQHVVKRGERLDQIAATYLGDPLRFWQLCDANGAMSPDDDIDAPGSTILIPVPQASIASP